MHHMAISINNVPVDEGENLVSFVPSAPAAMPLILFYKKLMTTAIMVILLMK